MIIKAKRIKGLGIFSDYTWETGLEDFSRFNVIYGWNGAGKTTLSRLFSALPTGKLDDFPDLEYQLETDSDTYDKSHPFDRPIRVFNRDYVIANVNIVQARARQILILGEENKKIAEQVAADEAQLQAKQANLRKAGDQLEKAKKRREKMLSDIAKTIVQSTSGLTPRSYRKPEAEKALSELTSASILDEGTVVSLVTQLKQDERPELPALAVAEVSLQERPATLDEALRHIETTGRRLCASPVNSEQLPRLRDHLDIARWVEAGVGLHQRHSCERCEFCDQALLPDRTDRLARHFSEEDRKLKAEIDQLLVLFDVLTHAISSTRPVDKANLYADLQPGFQSASEELTVARDALELQLATFRDALIAKKDNVRLIGQPEGHFDIAAILRAVAGVNVHITKHNERSKTFAASTDSARRQLERHHLSTIRDDMLDLDKSITDQGSHMTRLTDGDPANPEDLGISALEQRIRDQRAKISSGHKGCEELNHALGTFLGRDELRFEVDDDAYRLLRNDTPATNLSEGEKTAIGFVHFVIHLRDQGFDIKRSIVVVDDPISSLDSSAMFQAFAYLKNAVGDAHQVFLLTHNFDFLRLLLNWLTYFRKHRRLYMIKNFFSNSGKRSASISELDPLLENHESEYHYLFKLLHAFESDGTIEKTYAIPNIARKVLDTFLMFRVPSNQTTYQKLESLKAHFDAIKLTAIYKFTNDQSHITGKGFDPSLVPETQKTVKYLLEMIETVFPDHYKILLESLHT